MRIIFTWPSTHHYGGGVRVLWELASHLSSRGHQVTFVHGPAWPQRITHVDQLPAFDWHPGVQHRIVDDLADPSLPEGDVVFNPGCPDRLGLPVVLIQGFRMIPSAWERDAFRARAPKVCIARWLLDVGRSFGVPDEQLWYVPNGMDHTVFEVRRPLDDRPYDVAVIHNSHPSKGWRVGLAALRSLLERRPGTRALVFGMYEPESELPAGVDLKTGLDHAGLVREVYNQSKVFVQPSVHEGFGYPAVEAMACGAALVTTDNGGSSDYAIDGETAVVTPVNDVAALASSIAGLLDDEPTRLRLAHAGEQYVRRFDWALSAAQLEAHLDQYLADPDTYRHAPAPLDVEPEAS